MCVKVRWLCETGKNHMQNHTTAIGKPQQSNTQHLFLSAFKQRVLESQEVITPTLLWPSENIALCVTSLQQYDLFGAISISFFCCSFKT